jgi:cellulose synthase/poly-beta-1,6-N-acetylglucosamine synthase-like glycosyltransferase
MSWAAALLTLAALPFLGAAVYLAALALASRARTPPAPASDARFDVVVPAHDEEAGIADTVASLLALDYPRERFRVVVIADNCGDRTAERARAAGASVLERRDVLLRGKGHALAFAFDRLIAERAADALVVVDADSVVSANLLGALAARIAAGAEALQARHGVRNRDASWRTRLMHLAFALLHDVRAAGRERLGLSCGLRGNGMAFTTGLLRRVPHTAVSLVEDLEYAVTLGLAGVRVHDVAEASVLSEMPVSEEAARSQRARWEGGRLALALRAAPGLLLRGLPERSPLLLDLALELLIPPLGTLALAVAIGLALALGAAAAGVGVALAPWLLAALALIVYVSAGWRAAGLAARDLWQLRHVPGLLWWKLRLRTRPETWIRTPREPRR